MNCNICGRELTAPESVRRAIGPVCWANIMLEQAGRRDQNVCDYRLELLNDEKICIIHEIVNGPKISLTNCIERVIADIIEGYHLCPSVWAFVEHSNGGNLFGDYHEYDLVDISDAGLQWRYIWHSDVSTEIVKEVSTELIKLRVSHYRSGSTSSAINIQPHATETP